MASAGDYRMYFVFIVPSKPYFFLYQKPSSVFISDLDVCAPDFSFASVFELDTFSDNNISSF
jgi:hypothetical protein